MSHKTFDFLISKYNLFKAITSPLREVYGFDFGYMKVIDGHRYILLEDNLNCMTDFALNIKKSSIFYGQNITCCHDCGYNFTLWPDAPTSDAMNIYHKHQAWNGVTISRQIGDNVELWWFIANKRHSNAREFFIRQKSLLLQFIDFFNLHMTYLGLDKVADINMLSFEHGFNTEFDMQQSVSYVNEQQLSKKFSDLLKSNGVVINVKGSPAKLSEKDLDVLRLINHGLTAKNIAEKSGLSPKTIQHRIEQIKHKIGAHYRSELVEFYDLTMKRVIG